MGQFINNNAMVTSGVRCSLDRARAREQATRFGNGYLVTMVGLYHDTMPREGIPHWPAPPPAVSADDLDVLIRGGFMLCGTPEEVCEQLQDYVEAGVDQLCFGVPNDVTHEEALEMIEVFGKHVIPEFDRDPVISTDRYRATAKPKFAPFNGAPPDLHTIWTG